VFFHSFFLSFFLFFLVIGYGPVQMALGWVLPPLDHIQLEVEFAHAPYLQDDHEICFLSIRLPFSLCMQLCSLGGLHQQRG